MKADIQRNYSLSTLVLLFFLFSFVGWIWEVGYYFIQDGILVNRGVLFGPWLPIYGAGGVLILVLLKRFFDRPVILFLIMGICGLVEYLTGWWLETFLHTRWWDYRDFVFQIQGRVCLIGLLFFGIGGLVFVYQIAPKMDNIFRKMKNSAKNILCMVLVLTFLADFLYSMTHPNQGMGITMPVQKMQVWCSLTFTFARV